MWKPTHEGLLELTNLFKESRSKDNTKQREIYNHNEFPNYLLYILNSGDTEIEVRQVAGLSLKGIMERSFLSMTEESIEFFKENVLKCFLDANNTIRKTISNLINTFIRHGGTEMWPEILDFILENLESNMGVEMSLETLNIIIEDSGSFLEDKHQKFLQDLLPKLILFLDSTGRQNNTDRNDDLINLVLSTLFMLLENCSSTITQYLSDIKKVLGNLHNSENLKTRFQLGRCWITIVRMNREILFEVTDTLFTFFVNNLTVEYYEMNFISAEFFLTLVDDGEDNDIITNEGIKVYLQNNLKSLIVYSIHYMKLTPNDIAGFENKSGESSNSNSNLSQKNKSSLEETEDETNEDGDEEGNSDGYNPNWTLRKCCSKLIDKLATLFPIKVYEIVKPILENDMQHQEWMIKERSILALGAIGVGAYSALKPHLATLISFLIRELAHPHKLVRAISCWALSRFTKFILIDNLGDNSYDLFKEYLCEILKKFLDPEIIVQEASCTAFSTMVVTKKEKLEPYLFDIFKIISNVFNKYTGTSQLTLYEIISLLTEYYPDHFKNQSLVEEVLTCVIKKWYDMVKCQDFKNISTLFEMVYSIIKVSDSLIIQYFDCFLSSALIIIEFHYNAYTSNENDINFLDRDLTSKSVDLISLLCQRYPQSIKDHPSKQKILDYFFKLIETNDLYIKHYLIALIGDLCKADTTILLSKFEGVINIVFNSLEFSEGNKIESIEMEKMSVCNNSCWTVGQLSLSYPEQMRLYVSPILSKLLKILSLPRNISICIGRLALIDPLNISMYLDNFLKQFCLSLRYVKDSPEKREAFSGLCRSILHNPNGVMNFFAFFCDAICQYDDAPEDLENLFQNIILSYRNTLRETWMDYFKLFPEKLKIKMTTRFKLE